MDLAGGRPHAAHAVAHLRAAMHDHATRLFEHDLHESFGSAAGAARAAGLGWQAARAAMRVEHAVAGGLSEAERRTLFEAHVAAMRQQGTGASDDA